MCSINSAHLSIADGDLRALPVFKSINSPAFISNFGTFTLCWFSAFNINIDLPLGNGILSEAFNASNDDILAKGDQVIYLPVLSNEKLVSVTASISVYSISFNIELTISSF